MKKSLFVLAALSLTVAAPAYAADSSAQTATHGTELKTKNSAPCSTPQEKRSKDCAKSSH